MTSSDDSERKPLRMNVRDYQCGAFSWRPRWLQRFASPYYVFVFFNILGFCQGAYKSYMVGTMSTLERRFGFSTKSIALILVAESISPVFLDIPLGYIAGRFSRPKLLAFGMLFVSVSSVLVALPYALYGPATHLLAKSADVFADAKKFEFCGESPSYDSCSVVDVTGATDNLAFVIMFVASFVNGIGMSVLNVAGLSYMDDSVKKKNSPMYIGSSYALRALGPALGFLGAGLCLSLYEDPFYKPNISTTDPRWIGCWWLGYVVCGCVQAVASIPVLLFPKVMPSRLLDPRRDDNQRSDNQRSDNQRNGNQRSDNQRNGNQRSYNQRSHNRRDYNQHNDRGHFNEMVKSVWRLLTTRLYILQVLTSVLMVSGFNGFGMFAAKYMETQFRTSAAMASTFAGLVSTMFLIVSFFVSGCVLHRLRPTPRTIAVYNAAVAVAVAFGFAMAMLIKCHYASMPGVTVFKGSLDLENECNRQCDCTSRSYQPVCEPVGQTLYFSPCHAGCPTPPAGGVFNLTKLTDCHCLKRDEDDDFFTGNVLNGFCKGTCAMFMQYMIIISLTQFIGSSTSVGSTLMILRSIRTSDKAMALGFSNALGNLLAYIPYPLVYGAVMDNSCLVWERTCQTRGNCWLYDLDKLRYSYFGTSIAYLGVTLVLATGVSVFASDIVDFYGDSYEEVAREDDHEPPARNGKYRRLSSEDIDGPDERRFTM